MRINPINQQTKAKWGGKNLFVLRRARRNGKKGTLNMRMRSEGFRGLESVSDADATIERNSLFFFLSFGRPRYLITLA